MLRPLHFSVEHTGANRKRDKQRRKQKRGIQRDPHTERERDRETNTHTNRERETETYGQTETNRREEGVRPPKASDSTLRAAS